MRQISFRKAVPALLISASALGACTTTSAKPRTIVHEAPREVLATPAPEPVPHVRVVAIPEPLPLPGQLKPVESSMPPPETADPRRRVSTANAAARVQPSRDGYLNAIQQYPWTDGALYQVYAAPGQVTDIALQEGEQLVGPGPVAAGDTVRWIIGDTVSGSGANARVHILIKPTRPDISTNLVINTDRRTYHLELRATPSTWMASVSWTYPHDQLIALRAAEAERARDTPLASGIDIATLNFRYRIDGDRPDWRPVRVFDDGRQIFIEFAEGVERTDMPPLFVTGDTGAAELVNYRVAGRYMIVDRLFSRAELRLASGKREARVSIERESPRRKGRS
ncbi:P-type conjugative transfer protein TrbG [Sphingopyxis alaskensis]|uniref:Conjugal transfer protein TrbG/VirB9/CagX n=1 Tax=Sphingopyxis alaskensis (strain DSM 13593 / LMG 18877 / RB2256) TaxID=317655 RepID=Q1GPW0_SPHAL|nr:P-type conjugative transfer protein TrbG [Sphingopyxis alaskensis]ABF54312.1 Conjugal transfer protein TrbG/VirB9/CagX [Sphingopyxis alaskensis RB2256]MCM3417975.1 P-type conjugative transfer protein TrbG [Sphingopyxis alaskensis]